jgi:hypothetical protein
MHITQVPAHASNFTATPTAKSGIVFHWIVGEISAADAVFSRAGSRVSAHYSVGSNGEVHQHVPDQFIAWHAGNWEANNKYIGIEHAGGQEDPNGRMAPDRKKRKVPTQVCHDTSVRLCYELCRKMKINRLVLGHNAFRHKQFRATQCSGFLDVEYIISKVNGMLAGQLPSFGFTLQVKNNNLYFKDWNSNEVMFNVPYPYKIYKTENVGEFDRYPEKTLTVTFPQSAGNPLEVNLDKAKYRVQIAGYSQSVDLRENSTTQEALEAPEIENELSSGLEVESPVVVDKPIDKSSVLEKYTGILKDKIDLTTEEYLKTRKEEASLDEFLGLYEDKLDLTTEEYLKTRKEEAKLTDSQKYDDLKKDFEKVLEGAKKEKLDLEKVLIGLFKSGNPQSVISGGLAYILAITAGAGENTQISALVGSYVITLVAYGIRFILDKIKS